ncbi:MULTISPECIES: DJ-1/PfpI family protein [unclassified Symbiopectobacterium]|uniref:DJ-1/PfpI family protein n=1 Tax=unclassified Symbiopectobacterium TaxID=2794573 RepID=UPI002226C0E2|nr:MULTISPECIES: DJ-1/PfpI family protein [unclassified Symbiopectobacterium]MCW2473085.1 DJ-1/PfpI family protein [Candidatus Symbiopectobacterium sp. NZEC151]MCW2483130.1 DJ-1/PfpI family protein [Candidatus Symbiopectobacterium sp. NZEC135]MCW2488678.1 DJ-1/PfpI family protein [Candidatus Symbiopectobacterium sp. NZEC127]
MTLQIGIYVFDNVEVLDFAGPYEVFTCATRVAGGPEPRFNVFTLGEKRASVRARAGLKIDPDYALDDHPALDCLIVPGGVVTAEMEKSSVIDWLARQIPQTTITASVCTGVFLLAKTGKFDSSSVTTHWEDIADLKALFPTLDVKSDVRWVDQGALVSSAGISAGIDMSLHLVERFAGRALAESTARQLEFDWTENPE